MLLKLEFVMDVALKVLHFNLHYHKTLKRPTWPCNVLALKLQLLCRNICSFVCYFCYLTRYPALLLFSCALSLMLDIQIKIPILSIHALFFKYCILDIVSTQLFRWWILGSVVLLSHANYVQRIALPLPAVAKKVQTD